MVAEVKRQRSSPNDLWAQEEARVRRRKWEDLLAMHIRSWGLPEPETEYRFDDVRRWRFDFAWPTFMVAAEVEGVLPPWAGAGGRHQRAAGYANDAEKYNAAQLSGWTVLRFTPVQVKSAYAIRQIEIALSRAALGRER